MTGEQAIRLVEITKRKADELFEELIAELRDSGLGELEPLDDDESAAATDPTARVVSHDNAWSLGETRLEGNWHLVDSGKKGVTYAWPDGNLDEYDAFDTYRGDGDFDGMMLALGVSQSGPRPGAVIGFVLFGGKGSKRGITYFFPADDFAKTSNKVSMIRGGGTTGRAGFGPGDTLPTAYDRFRTEMLRDRVAGKWNVQAVVADSDDYDTMLGHTAIQARLRGLA